MDDIDDIIWQYNKERAYEALYDDEMCLVDSLSTPSKKTKLLTLKMLNLTI